MIEQDSQTREIAPLYKEQVAIDKVQLLPGLTPLRIFEVLYPLWDVEVVGVQEEGRPYEMIEKFLERGIAQAGLNTPEALTNFFQLDASLITKVLNFLTTIGHIQYINQTLQLTPLGLRSVQEGEKIVPKETRQKLYFDAFRLRPLVSSHYDNRLRILSEQEAERYKETHYNALRLFSFQPWQPGAVSELGRNPHSAQHNLPDEIRDLNTRGVMPAFLPMYIIETRKQTVQAQTYYVVYTRIRDMRDEFFEGIVNAYPEILGALYAEEVLNVEKLWRDWLSKIGATEARLSQSSNGIWKALFTPQLLRTQRTGMPSVAAIGTYRLERGYFIQIWCEDPATRREGALEMTLRSIKRRPRSTTLQDIQEQLQRFADRLQVEGLTIQDLRAWTSTGAVNAVDLLDNIIGQVYKR